MIDLASWRQRLGTGLLSSTAFAAVLLAAPAWAQTNTAPTTTAADNNEVIVTAQRRAEASKDVPITVTTLNPDQLATGNVNRLSDTARLTPALRFDTQGPAMQPTIRGIGTAVTTSGGGPNVGIYVDGYFNANTYVSDFDLTNVRSVQVLKGPQGTLFGRNTTGGAILVTTADPSHDAGGTVAASYGSFNAMKLQGYATTGLSDNLAWNIEGQYRSGDGYFTNLATGDDSAGAYENWSVRTGLLWDISPNVSALLRYTHAETDDPTTQLVNAYVDGGSAHFYDLVTPTGQAQLAAQFHIPTNSSVGQPLVHLLSVTTPGTLTTSPGDVVLPGPASFHTKSDTVQATIRADLGFADLTSYTQYRKDNSPYFGDLDATAIPFFDINVNVEDKTLSQEFLLNSKGNDRLQWTAGFSFFRIEDTWDVNASFNFSPFGDFGGSTTTTTSYAAFADATYEFAPRWFLTAGARYSFDKVSDASFVTNGNTALTGWEDSDGSFVFGTPGNTRISVPDLDNDAFTPRVVLRYAPDDNSSVYASFSRGYKAGILNVGGLSRVPVRPENIDAYEIGYKWDNHRTAFSAAAFYYDYQDLQFSSFQNGAAQIRNADGKVYGVEAQARFRVTDDFSITAGGAYTHAEYTNFANDPYYTYCDPSLLFPDPMSCQLTGLPDGALTQVTRDGHGKQMQRSPEWTANLTASYDIRDVAGGLVTLSGNVYYTSDFFFDANEQFQQDAYTLLSLRAQWADPSQRYTLAAFGDNVTDERYQTQVLFNTLGIGSVWSAPATWGVEVKARY